jgi:methylated-DNA-[protein]-cysteine S-methyltransferase
MPPIVNPQRFMIFDTSIGPCGIAWSPTGVLAVQLPEADANGTRRHLERRFPGAQDAAPTPDIQRCVASIVRLLQGDAADLSSVALDLEGLSPFQRRVYEAARAIPPGTTLS